MTCPICHKPECDGVRCPELPKELDDIGDTYREVDPISKTLHSAASELRERRAYADKTRAFVTHNKDENNIPGPQDHGGLPCACEFDDDGNEVVTCQFHVELRAEVERMNKTRFRCVCPKCRNPWDANHLMLVDEQRHEIERLKGRCQTEANAKVALMTERDTLRERLEIVEKLVRTRLAEAKKVKREIGADEYDAVLSANAILAILKEGKE